MTDAPKPGSPVLNLGSLPESIERRRAPHYDLRLQPIGRHLGMKKLGFNLTELAPGSRSFPYHFHHVNDEAFFVLEGNGLLRWSGGESAIGPGDIIGLPAGPGGAHQIKNTGSVPLRYLAISSIEDPEVVEYPDAKKYGVIAGRPPGGTIQEAAFSAFAFAAHKVDYWEGEE